MSDEVFNIACEDENIVTEEEINLLSGLATEYEEYKERVRGMFSNNKICFNISSPPI